jgi:hypothetical protein
MVCKICGSQVLIPEGQVDPPKFCTKCGVKLAEGKTAFWIVGAVLVLMALGMITDFIKPSGTSSTPSSNNEAVMKAQREAEAFKAMTTAEHLKAVALDQITTPQQATLAQRHLEAISSNAPEYKQALALNSRVQSKKKALEEEADIAKNPLQVVSSNWERGGFSNIAIWHVTFRNRSNRPVGNIKYKTEYFSETGTSVDRGGVSGLLAESKTVQKVIPPKGQRTIEINDGFVHSEAHRASFALASWEYVVDAR